MDEQRLGRALRQGPPFATSYVARALALDASLGGRRGAGVGRLVLLMAVTALLLVGMLGGLAAVGSLRDDSPGPLREDAGVIRGLDGQAFMEAWEATGSRSACSEPQPANASLVQWTCADAGEGNLYDEGVILLGESRSAIHSIEAWVALTDGGPVDAVHAGGMFAFVAETADFTGADPAAAGAWVRENAGTKSGQLDISGVTYTLSGTAERRVLKIAPSVAAFLETPLPASSPPPAAANPSASLGCFLSTRCSPSPAAEIETESWVPFTSERYSYMIAHPPTWIATPATRAWAFETDQDEPGFSGGSDEFAERNPRTIGEIEDTSDFDYPASHQGYPIWFTTFAVDVPAGTPEDRWIADYYASRPWMAPGFCEYADADLREIFVDGQPGTLVVGDTDCGDSAFVFIDGRVHVFWLDAYDRPAQIPGWRSLKTALLEAFLSTVGFRP